ncbi:uncharacterized protein LOC132172957 [Corylus avellana]|uniref:uncharacterized protein LOC132172957 n=1 Tax=Corylus avellana TaxID=13451 RepID=UPI00286CAFE1|nr:uncharacterized protein LOC132172957 [Corylus avellana]
MCNDPPEDLQHLFLDCPFARAIWRNTAWPINVSVFSNLPIAEWSKAIINPSSHLGIPSDQVWEFQISALVTMDCSWLARNKLIHNGSVPDPVSCLKSISSMVKAHLKAWLDSAFVPEAWSPPPLGFLKANFDVAIRPLFSVAAVVLNDHTGLIVAVCTKKLPHLDATVGEANAALLAVSFAADFGCSSILLEGDSQLCILAINKDHLFSDWLCAPMIADIHLHLLLFS